MGRTRVFLARPRKIEAQEAGIFGAPWLEKSKKVESSFWAAKNQSNSQISIADKRLKLSQKTLI
jgi:hypothetical protein